MRGLLAGLVAGLLAGGVAYVLGEPHIDAAIAIEEAAGGHSHEGAEAEAEEEPLVSRDGQRAGLILATTVGGIALGAIFGAVVHVARRYSAASATTLVVTLALGGWAAIQAVPFFKYPANPPAVGDPETIDKRTWLWVASVLLGLAAVGTSVYLARIVRTQQTSVRIAAPAAGFVAVVALGYVLLPDVDEVPSDFPATLLWEFRLSSLATQATLWIALGLAFAFLSERAANKSEVAHAA